MDSSRSMNKKEEQPQESSLRAEDAVLIKEENKNPVSSPRPPLASSKNHAQPTSADEENDSDDSKTLQILQEAFGVTKTGTCIRHPTCPVVFGLTSSSGAATKVVSCRVCFSEEKSVGIRQGKSFAAVVQQLQRQAIPDGSEAALEFSNSSLFQNSINSGDFGSSMGSMGSCLPEGMVNNAASSLLMFLQQPKAMESVMKRLTQVQNWMLRQKEKEVLSLQLHIHRLEQRLADEQKQCQEQRNTVRALRRTIQQDLKIIKTMATQKQMQDEQAAAAAAAHNELLMSGSSHGGGLPLGSAHGLPNGSAHGLPIGSGHMLDNSDHSPLKKSMASPFMRSPPKRQPSPHHPPSTGVANTTGMMGSKAQGSSYSSPAKSRRQNPNSLRSLAANMSTRTIDTSIPIPEDGEQDLEAAEAATKEERSKNQQYWNEDDLQTMKTSKIFESFRGGLLDIPKSPPRARHDRDDSENGNGPLRRKKLQLNSSDMDALKLPARALSRSSSTAAGAPTDGDNSKEISLDLLAAQLSSLPLSRKINGQSPEQFFVEKVPSNPAMPAAPALLNSGGSGGGNKKKKNGVPTSLQERILQNPGAIVSLSPAAASNHTAAAAPAPAPSPSVVTGTYSIITMDTGPSETVETSVETAMTASPETFAQEINSPEEGFTDAASTRTDQHKSVATDDAVIHEEPEEDELDAGATAGETSEKFVFSVTGATCQDKFGDEGTYTGNILVTEGLPHGQGKMDYESGRIYDGEWVSGQWHGKGKLLNPNGDSYDGEFFFDARHGQGVYRWDNGDVYTGSFMSDKRHGKGKFSFHNGNIYEGEFCDGMFEGFGRYEFADGYYEGDWKEGRYNGSGELMYANGGKYTGEFRNSVAHGFGMEVLPDGRKRRGVWSDGKPTDYFEKDEKEAGD